MVADILHLPSKVTAVLKLAIMVLSTKDIMKVDSRGLLSPRNIPRLIDFCNEFSIDPEVVRGMVAIAKGDLDGITRLILHFGKINNAQLESIIQVFTQITGVNPTSLVVKNDGKDNKQALKDLSYPTLFQMFDVQSVGKLDYPEFQDLLKYLNVDLSPSKSLELFTVSATDSAMSQSEFETAMKSLESQVTARVMTYVGLSTAMLVKIFILGLVLLLGLFVFIFVGIAAFNTNSTFATVINSLLPILAALGVNTSSLSSGTAEVKSLLPKAEDLVKQVTKMFTKRI